MTEQVLLWASPARLMAGRGRFEWRITVIRSRWDGAPSTLYEFRPFGATAWESQRRWPSYDINNGMTLGLPAVTRELHDLHRETLRQWFRPATEPTHAGLQYVMPGCEKDQTRGPAQMSLF